MYPISFPRNSVNVYWTAASSVQDIRGSPGEAGNGKQAHREKHRGGELCCESGAELCEATEEKKISFESSQVAFKLYSAAELSKMIDVSNHTWK